jgi:catechol 2,3-dioxygenase-like lactoylglutathione lyase family enzyme
VTVLEKGRVAARLPAQDLERARRWYSEKLGLEPVDERPGGLLYRAANGCDFALYQSQGSSPGTFTQMGWEVDDIEATVRELKERGVEPVLKDALDRVWDGTDGVYVTWDTDSVDAAYAPGTTEPEPGGLTSHEVLEIARIVGERGFTAFDNVELAPIYDLSGITGKLVWCVLAELLYANAKARL